MANETLQEQMDNILNSELSENEIIFEEDSFNNPSVYIYRGRTYYSRGRYCNYPYPHIRRFGDCSYYTSVNFNWKMNSRNRLNAIERDIVNLFDQAFLGKTKAQLSLGIRYQDGNMGLSKNLSEAYAWFNVALQNEHKSAQYMIDKLMDQMMAHEMAEGKERTAWILEKITKNTRERNIWIRENLLKHNSSEYYNSTVQDHPQEQSAPHDQHTRTTDE